MPEYYNHNLHTVYLIGPQGQSIKVLPRSKIVLSDYYDRYCSRGYISRVDQAQVRPSPVRKPTQTHKLGVAKQPAQIPQARSTPRGTKLVGKPLKTDPNELLTANLRVSSYPISDGIGVGILSYNRLDSLRRLVNSIKAHTDLRRTTVFISDDASTDERLQAYLKELEAEGCFTVIRNIARLGVAGNTNRLLRCLGRFKHGLLLNDDIQILAFGWERLYADAAQQTGLHHFCFHQEGVYGARTGRLQTHNNVELLVIDSKPQGAALYFSHEMLGNIGYFDEEAFGLYGMEHVDWSMRAGKIQGPGFFDVANSRRYFKLHNEGSAVPDRLAELHKSRETFANLDPSRCYIAAQPRSEVPTITYVVPYRDCGRLSALDVVLSGIRAQRFACIKIVLSEHDTEPRAQHLCHPGVIHVFVQSHSEEAFNKSRAFNGGVAAATSNTVVLHDADMLVPALYTKSIMDRMERYDSCHLGKSVMYTTEDGCARIVLSGLVDADVGCDRVVGYFEGGSLACRRYAYWSCGGFNEDFRGYGVEDCEFYNRLSNNSRFLEARSYDFLHLWHQRTDGWHKQHEINRQLGRQLDTLPITKRVSDQIQQLRARGYSQHVDQALRGNR